MVVRFGVSALVSVIGLGGCVTFDQIDAGLSTLKGKTLKQTIAVMGYPDSERKIADKTIYNWGNEESVTLTIPTTTSATSYVGGQAIYTSIQGSRTNTYNYSCSVDVIVGKGGTVEAVEYSGNLGGCERYAALASPK